MTSCATAPIASLCASSSAAIGSIRQVRRKASAHHVAEREDVRIRDRIVGEQSVLAARHEVVREQQLQVLGEVRLPESGRLDKLGHRHFPAAQHVEDLQPHRLAQHLEALGDAYQQFRVQRGSSHARESPTSELLSGNMDGGWRGSEAPRSGASGRSNSGGLARSRNAGKVVLIMAYRTRPPTR